MVEVSVLFERGTPLSVPQIQRTEFVWLQAASIGYCLRMVVVYRG